MSTNLDHQAPHLRAVLPALLVALAVLQHPATAEPARPKGGSEPSLAFARVPETISWELPTDEALSVPTFVAPQIDRSAAFQLRSERAGLARPELEATTIRRGFTGTGGGPPSAVERAVGVKLGPDRFSLATSFITGAGAWQSTDTRFDWALARKPADSETGLRWGLATGGDVGMAGTANQNASATLGYRQRLLDNVTLTSEIALASTYAFAARNMPEATVTPQMQVLADLTGPMSGPWRTVLDVKLSRQVPLAGSEFQSNASAMLRLKYQLK
ncbi:hypothetical protein [Bosea sp. BK604]|uniref:hypothetical protein n=1 Tax=Bosea sp. BK604 TaxID=2512180 RepID=UPI00104E1676|nr:hypothetical protein [Bosea sp. BK604]TCR63416.1 hypothetical protein EV560_10863 [Bosea sp. BK604]